MLNRTPRNETMKITKYKPPKKNSNKKRRDMHKAIRPSNNDKKNNKYRINITKIIIKKQKNKKQTNKQKIMLI